MFRQIVVSLQKSFPFIAILLVVPISAFGQNENSPAAIFVTTSMIPNGGTLLRLQRQSPWDTEIVAPLESIDANVRVAGDFVYAIDSSVDRILIFEKNGDPVDFFEVGKETQPRDIAVISPNLAYVTRANATHLYRVDPTTGIGENSVDLSIFADADGIPDMERMIVVGSRLFIQLRRLNLTPGMESNNGALAVIDLNSETIIDADPATTELNAIELLGPAPRLRMHTDTSQNVLLASSTDGFHLSFNGGLEQVNLETLSSEGFVLAEADLAAMGGFVVTDNLDGYFLFHTDIVPSNHLHEFSFEKRAEFCPEIVFDYGMYLDALLFDPQTGFVYMPSSPGGLYVVDTKTNEQLPGSPIQFQGVVNDQALAELILGDINGDGLVTLLDVTPFVDLLTSGQFREEADINRDGILDLLDVGPFVDLVLK